MRQLIRAGLLFLFLTQVALAAWILAVPHTFFAIPWVNMGMPYNEHLLLDYGAMNLAIAVPLGYAWWTREPRHSRVALTAYLVFSALHLVIHTRYLDHLPPSQAAILMVVLALAAAIPTAMLIALRRSTPRRPAAPTPATPHGPGSR